MTEPSSARRRSLTALPLLLLPLLLTACASGGGSPSTGGSGGSASSVAGASASTSAAASGSGVYEKYTTGAQFCALVGLADVSTAMQGAADYSKTTVTASPAECTYSNGHASGVVTVAWNPAGAGALDDLLEISPKDKPASIDVGGHAGRSLNGDVQVVDGDAAIDVFGVPSSDPTRLAALAAVFLKKVG